MSEETSMNRQDYLSILETMNNEEYFCDFKLRKSNYTFLQKTEWGLREIYLPYRHSVDLDRNDEFCLSVDVYYGVRFDILRKWLASFVPYSLSSGVCVCVREGDFGKRYNYEILEDASELSKDYSCLVNGVRENAKCFFQRYDGLQMYYKNRVEGEFLRGKMDLSEYLLGPERIFDLMVATKIVNPAKYEEVKKKAVDFCMTYIDKPNYREYKDKMPEIFAFIDKGDFNVKRSRKK